MPSSNQKDNDVPETAPPAQTGAPASPMALEGVRVIDVGTFLAGPMPRP
jgi:hypothetical protein